MPVTKTAKRALRGSQRKEKVNRTIFSVLDAAIRQAKRDKKKEAVKKVFSLADRAAKKHLIHTKKADRIKRKISSVLA